MNRLVVLDQVRGFAALYVACSHLVLHRLPIDSDWARLPWAFGQEAVVVFFLISGLAIRLSIESREGKNWGLFLQRRFIRLVPIILLGLLLGYACASIEYGEWRPLRGLELLGNMLFLQDFSPVKPGTIVNTYYGNATLWSLSYEWWFYIQCAIIWRFVPQQHRTNAVGLLSVCAISTLIFLPNAGAYWIGYMILWWAGSALVKPKSEDFKRALVWVWMATIMTVCVALVRNGFTGLLERPGVFPFLVVRHFCIIAFLLTAVAIFAHKQWGAFFFRIRGFAWLAPYSYALYVLHYPLASDASWLKRFGLETGFAAFSSYTAVVIVAVWWAVSKYEPWAQGFLKAGFRIETERKY